MKIETSIYTKTCILRHEGEIVAIVTDEQMKPYGLEIAVPVPKKKDSK